MKLTEDQIQELYKFTRKHYVDWYDVQTELVDHLANGIEAHLEQNPNATFESALNSEFKKFGIMGFSDVIEEKTKALNKQYRILVWQYFKDFFKLPKIILTVFLVWIYFELFQLIPNKNWMVIPTFIILFIVPTIFFINVTKQIRRIEYLTNKKWLFDSVSLQLGGLVNVLNIGFCFGMHLENISVWSTLFQFMFSTGVVLFGMVIYISIFIVSPKLRKGMAKLHPEYIFA